MRRAQCLLALGVAAQSGLAVASLPRGVGPEFASFYQSKGDFKCIGRPSISLSPARVNDNSCDCPDGSDEPGTSACSYIDHLSPPQPLQGSPSGNTNASSTLPGFWCANEGHVGTYVPFAYVDDGVCDYEFCCDGSEEFSGKVKCENRCAAIGREHRAAEEEKRKTLERALKKRRVLVREAKTARSRVESGIVTLKQEIAALEIKKGELQARLDQVEREERGKVVKTDGQEGKLGVLLRVAKDRVEALRSALDKVLDQRDDAKDRVEELEAILRAFKDEYNPNFNDEGVKTAVKAWEDYAAKYFQTEKGPAADSVTEEELLDLVKPDSETNGVNWKEFEDAPSSDADIIYNIEAYLPDFVRTWVHSKIRDLRVWLIENGMLADNPVAGQDSVLVTSARDAVMAVDGDLLSKRTALSDQESDLTKDYGPDGILRAIKDRCISTDSGEYTYELCWLGQTTQKSKKGHGDTSMGAYSGVETHDADEEERADGKGLGTGKRLVLKYENGQGCWNGPNRRTDVWLACAETEELWRVTESEKCVYKMEVGTPVACVQELQPETQPRDKDEL